MHAYPLLDTVCTDIPFVHVGVWQLCRVLYSIVALYLIYNINYFYTIATYYILLYYIIIIIIIIIIM